MCLALRCEAANGASSNAGAALIDRNSWLRAGKMRVMDVEPEKVHQRVPLFVGSKKEVEYLESFTKK